MSDGSYDNDVVFYIGDRMMAWLCECGAAALSYEPYKCRECGREPPPAKDNGAYAITKVTNELQ